MMAILNVKSLILIVSGVFSGAVAAMSWPDFPAPDYATVVVVSDNMTMNGVNMVTWEISAPKEVEEVLDFYRKKWKGKKGSDKKGYVENKFDQWNIITKQIKDRLFTVQLISNGLGSVGYLAISNLPEANIDPEKLGAGFPTLDGSRIMNDITTDDVSKRARTVIATNDKSVETNANYYINHYKGKGWRIVTATQIPDKNQAVLMLEKGGSSLNMTISKNPNNETMIFSVQEDI